MVVKSRTARWDKFYYEAGVNQSFIVYSYDPAENVIIDTAGSTKYPEHCYPLVAVGQMIEMLTEAGWTVKIMQGMEGYWWVGNDTPNGKSFYYKGLCNTLFVAVKAIL